MIRIEQVHLLIDASGGWIIDKTTLLRVVVDVPALDSMTYAQLRDFVEEYCHILPGSYTLAYLNGEPRNRIIVAFPDGKPMFIIEESHP